jgi:hypothetical protein
MKKILFFFAMLVSVAAGAQSTVQVNDLSANYVTQTVTFSVSWTNRTTSNHRNKVWVFIDFQPVTTPGLEGNWEAATITGAVQKTAGTVSEQSSRGFFLEGTTTDFRSPVTVQLSNINTAKFNWCAYTSDYPPNVTAENGSYMLRGTLPFIAIDIDGATVQYPHYTSLLTRTLIMR